MLARMEKHELIIIGQGPAGLSAAIYAARAGIETLVLGCDPKVAGDYDIDNYFGFEETISGRDLMAKGLKQALRFGATVRCEKVLAAHPVFGDGAQPATFEVKTDAGEYQALGVVLASGVARRRPSLKGLQEFEGKGVSWCVSCDGFFYRGKPVVAYGEGAFAANQALELTGYTQDVTLISPKAPAWPVEFNERLAAAGVKVVVAEPDRLEGASGLERVVLADGTVLPAHGFFVALGEASSLDFARTLGVELEGQFVKTDRDMVTNVPGVSAAGDCVGGFLQIAKAVGEGAVAGKAAISWVKSRRPKKEG